MNHNILFGLGMATAAMTAGGETENQPGREPVGRGAQFVVQTCACEDVAKRAIFAHPPWKDGAKGRVYGAFALDLSEAHKPQLRFFTGIRDGHGSTEGLIFRVYVDTQEVWRGFQRKGAWQAQCIDLASHAGRECVIELAVDSLGEHYACFGDPRVMDGEQLLTDLTDHVDEARKSIELMAEVPADELPEEYRASQRRDRDAKLAARPSPRQLAWQQLEYIGFAHFGVNTFTDREWGTGSEEPDIFNPTAFDADQWAETWKQAGMQMLILTAKHHDGFCLWPSQYTQHCVRNSPWRNGKGDVVKEVAEACRRAGIKFGVYLSPWDRNHPEYGNSPVYNDYFCNQLRELLTNYGPIAEVWFDGACGEGPNGKRQQYDWQRYYAVVRELQPDAVIAICGPDVRWVGNESGVARETEWSPQPRTARQITDAPYVWYPAECDVSIRPGWFYHAAQDDQVKSLPQLVDITFKSIGRNSVLLLNVPPDKRGLIHENDRTRLLELRRLLDATFRKNLLLGARGPEGTQALFDGELSSSMAVEEGHVIELQLPGKQDFNVIMIQEDIRKGQRVEAFSIDVKQNGEWQQLTTGTTVGYKRLLRVPQTSAEGIRLRIDRSLATACIASFGLYIGEL